jgi:hypothetical protein
VTNEGRWQRCIEQPRRRLARALAVGGLIGLLGLPSSGIGDTTASAIGTPGAAQVSSDDGARVPADAVGDPGEWDGLVTLILQDLEPGSNADTAAAIAVAQPTT